MAIMEIATYLGISNALLSESERSGEATSDAILENIIQATREAQLIMYELARADLFAELKGIE